jgi:phosphoserine phosphatase
MFIIHSSNEQLATQINQKISGDLHKKDNFFIIVNDEKIDLSKLRDEFQIDINYLSSDFNPNNFKAFVSDMDSTLINIECIDEIADFANLKPQVAKITEEAMQGKLDFNQSLKERVALLKGLDVAVLDKVYNQKLQINSGGEELIKFLKSKNMQTAVVSGGFDFFTSKLKAKLKLDFQLANQLEIKENKLTGITTGEVINATSKANFVENMQFKNSQIVTCGDGANDLEMMEKSGLSIAYHAKDSVNKKADIIIKFGGLDLIIDIFKVKF